MKEGAVCSFNMQLSTRGSSEVLGGLCEKGLVIASEVRAGRQTQLTFDPQHFYLLTYLIFTFLT